MARIDIGNQYPATVFTPQGAEVFAKRNWADPWEWFPFGRVIEAEERVAPGVSQARIAYDFGTIGRAERGGVIGVEPYYSLEQWYVAIRAVDWYGSADLWLGVVQPEQVRPSGQTAYPEGETTFTAYGLEWLLDRIEITGSHTESVGVIDRNLVFNRQRNRGGMLFGNKSATIGPTGSYLFADSYGEAGSIWTNGDIIAYLFANYVGPYSALNWNITGDYEYLFSLAEEWDFEGLSVFEAMNRLIDRRRGLGWFLNTDGESTVWIVVYETISEFGDTFGFAGYRDVDPTLTINPVAQYDQIFVRGGPVCSCFTLGFADGTLIEGWSTDDQDDYEAGSDKASPDAGDHDLARTADKFENVFTRYDVPDDWDGRAGDGEGGTLYETIPVNYFDGTIDYTTGYAPHKPGLRFEDFLPILLPQASTAGEPEFQKPFGVILYDGDNYFVDKLPEEPEELNKNISFETLDDGLAIRVKANPAHFLAANHWSETAEDTDTDPLIDYESIIATVFMRTDTHIKALATVPGAYWSDTPRIKTLNLPDATYWRIIPGTVIDVVDGELVKSAGLTVRDDSARVAALALAAAWWYQKRNTVKYTVQNISFRHPIGDQIAWISGPEGYTPVFTTVTRRKWSFHGDQGCTTEVETGYTEIDFERMAGA